MAHMDVNLICYLIEDGHWASKGYPLKLNEYLAIGKPVVATPIDAVKRYFGGVVDIATNSEEVAAAIQRALSSGGIATPEERRAVASRNTWDRRVDLLDKWLCDVSAG
jgi:glycosyltransferase involved in cell wall biosynthesis